jgi:hypothetical protein
LPRGSAKRVASSAISIVGVADICYDGQNFYDFLAGGAVPGEILQAFEGLLGDVDQFGLAVRASEG